MSRNAWLLLVSSWIASSVHADAASEARFHDELGREAYTRRSYDRALGHFLDAHRAAPSPMTSYNVALAAELADEPALAYQFFTTYLAADDLDPARRAHARERRDALARGLALVELVSHPPGARVFVDDPRLGGWGRTPTTVPVSAGAHRVELVHDGYVRHVTAIEAVTGEVTRVTAELTRETAELVLDVRPRDATVTIEHADGVVDATGQDRIVVPVGRVRVRVSAPGHEPTTHETTFHAGEHRSMRAHAIRRPPATGFLLLRTTDDVAATVWVDGRAWGDVPLRARLPVGEHEVRLVARDHVTWRGRLVVHADRTSTLDVALVRDER